MKKILSPVGAPTRRMVANEEVAAPQRRVLDEEVAAKIEAGKTRAGRKAKRNKAPDGTRPKPVDNKSKRSFVGIEPGQLVMVRGYRDTKWIVTTPPSAKFQRRGTGETVEVQSHTRKVGKAVVSVTLMGPDGVMIDVPIGWCKPVYG